MDYYHLAWQSYIVLASAISIFVFLIIRPLPLFISSGLQALATAVLFVPVSQLSEFGQTYAPLIAKLVIDIIAGTLTLEAITAPLLLMLLVFLVVWGILYACYWYIHRSRLESK
jgi:glucan phosphoethanolaminetransferase (alkaline phosphatase superfamily)